MVTRGGRKEAKENKFDTDLWRNKPHLVVFFFNQQKQKLYMVVGELYKRFETHTGGSYYLFSPKKWTNKMTFVTDHMAASLICHTPGKGLEVASPPGKEQRSQVPILWLKHTWQMKPCKWRSNFKCYSHKRKPNGWETIQHRTKDIAWFR